MNTLIATPMLSASTLIGDNVVNLQGEHLGEIKDFMLDTESGRILYGVLDFGGFLGIGNKLFAVPVQALRLDAENERFLLDVTKERLENAPGFDKDNWPRTASDDFLDRVYRHYDVTRTWSRTTEPTLN